jgi:hypothetical protein
MISTHVSVSRRSASSVDPLTSARITVACRRSPVRADAFGSWRGQAGAIAAGARVLAGAPAPVLAAAGARALAGAGVPAGANTPVLARCPQFAQERARAGNTVPHLGQCAGNCAPQFMQNRAEAGCSVWQRGHLITEHLSPNNSTKTDPKPSSNQHHRTSIAHGMGHAYDFCHIEKADP